MMAAALLWVLACFAGLFTMEEYFELPGPNAGDTNLMMTFDEHEWLAGQSNEFFVELDGVGSEGRVLTMQHPGGDLIRQVYRSTPKHMVQGR